MKNIRLLPLLSVGLLLLLPLSVSAEITGSGSYKNPYIVASTADIDEAMEKIESKKEIYVKLSSDITLNRGRMTTNRIYVNDGQSLQVLIMKKLAESAVKNKLSGRIQLILSKNTI